MITSQRSTPFTLPKGTAVRVDGGPKFVTDQDLSLQPRIPVRVGITALDAGTGGNVGPGEISQFDGTGFDQLELTNQRPTTGGTDRQAKVVTDDDRKALDEKLKKDARDKGVAQLQQRAGPEQTLPDMSVTVETKAETSSGPKARAGFSEAPVTGPTTMMIATTTPPMTSPARSPGERASNSPAPTAH